MYKNVSTNIQQSYVFRLISAFNRVISTYSVNRFLPHRALSSESITFDTAIIFSSYYNLLSRTAAYMNK
jgi:hypothetical protein